MILNNEIIGAFCQAIGSDNVLEQEPMSRHTTFRIGGPADYYLNPHSADEIIELLNICRNYEIPYFVLGNGSNLLVSDQGYRGAIIQIYRNMDGMEVKGTTITARAGVLLSSLAKKAMEYNLTGMEFAGGIPGTLGGAVVMNAGAYGGEMKDILKSVKVLSKEGEILVLQADQLEMGYRTSAIKVKEYMVLEAEIVLKEGDFEAIRETMRELTAKRTSKQPLDMPSAGSTFKRPEGHFAGKLIMDAGLRGYRVGGAQVSEKHCGFVVNAGDATAEDVRMLMHNVRAKVKEQYQVTLEPEVKFLGEFTCDL